MERFGPAVAQIAAIHTAFLWMSPEQFDVLRADVLRSWSVIQATAVQVPEPAKLAALLRLAGGPTCVQPLGSIPTKEAIPELFLYGHYLRNRFTALKLARLLGSWMIWSAAKKMALPAGVTFSIAPSSWARLC